MVSVLRIFTGGLGWVLGEYTYECSPLHMPLLYCDGIV